MNSNRKTLLAAAILGLIALTGYSQTIIQPIATPTPAASGSAVATPTPNPNAGTYKDAKLSIPQRITLANAVLSSGTDANSVYSAAQFMLGARPVINLINAFPKFSGSVLADPTLAGILSDSNQVSALFLNAVTFNTGTTAAIADKIAYLTPFLSSTILVPHSVLLLKATYATLVTKMAAQQLAAYDYAGAITSATSVVGWGCPQTIPLIVQCKVATRAPDGLSWALLDYFVQDYPHGQAGIDTIGSMFRALDGNLVRQNQFNAYQTSGTGVNPMAGVSMPQVTFLGNSLTVQALNAGVSGNFTKALQIADTVFAKAQQGAQLNSAVSLNAQWIRNKDLNVVRANAYVAALTVGQPFTIVELTGTSGN